MTGQLSRTASDMSHRRTGRTHPPYKGVSCPVVRSMSENDLLRGVLDACELLGWRTLHIRPARTSSSWRTAVQGSGAGFPDVLAVRGHRLVVAELKSATGKLTEDQNTWLLSFAAAGAETFVWRPADYPDGIVGALR